MPKEGKNKLMGNIYVTALTLARGKEKKKHQSIIWLYTRARVVVEKVFFVVVVFSSYLFVGPINSKSNKVKRS